MVVLSGLVSACDGSIGEVGQGAGVSGRGATGSGTPTCTAPCDPTDPAVATPGGLRIWRLTNQQYDNTVRDLLGDDTAPASSFIRDIGGAGFANNAALLGVSDAQAAAYRTAASKLASEAVASRLDTIFPCGATKVDDPTCARQFVETFGKKAFRRPLTDLEARAYVDFFAATKASLDAKTAITLVIETMLQSPYFLFRVELGEGAVPSGDIVRLGAYETASALSYYLWDTMPDAALLEAAGHDALGAQSSIESQVRRMIDDPRAHPVVESFYAQLLEYDQLAIISRDKTAYPDAALQLASMATENASFVESVVFGTDGRLETLLTAPYTFVDSHLAPLYGLAAGGSGFRRVDLDPSQRAGILTQLGFLSVHATPLASSPPRRGKYVLQKLLCASIPAPPDNIPKIEDPSAQNPRTTRQRFEAHESNPTCRACHGVIDPFGLPFEEFDAMGQFRTTENGIKIDSSTVVTGQGALDGPVRDAVDLSKKLATSEALRTCLVRQTFRYALGRGEQATDEAYLSDMTNRFGVAQFKLKELAVSMAMSNVFLSRKVIQ